MKIGAGIKKLRVEKLRLNQKVFADGVGITQSYLCLIERGEKKPSLDTLEKIANYLEVPIPVLFWFSIEDSDIKTDKKEAYKILKEPINTMIMGVI